MARGTFISYVRTIMSKQATKKLLQWLCRVNSCLPSYKRMQIDIIVKVEIF